MFLYLSEFIGVYLWTPFLMSEFQMTESLFVYGTLMNPLVQQRVFGRTAPGEADRLVGFRLNEFHCGLLCKVNPLAATLSVGVQ